MPTPIRIRVRLVSKKQPAAILMAALVCGLAHPAQANDLAGMGVGYMTCTQFADFYKDDAEGVETGFFNWAQGFMSGVNFGNFTDEHAVAGKTVNLAAMELKEQKAFLRRYCDQHPLAQYVDAVLHLLMEMHFRTLKGTPQ